MKVPSVLRFFGGAILGSLSGALMWMYTFGAEITSSGSLWVACFLIAPSMLVLFTIFGLPLFLWMRDMKSWPLTLGVALVGGALCGVAATVLFGGPDSSQATGAFGVIGTVTALIAWLFVSSNNTFHSDGSRAARENRR